MIALAGCPLFAASVQASEPGWAGPGWYIWNKAIWAPALSAREGASAGPYPTQEQCEAARPVNLFNGQAIPIFACFYFASEADFERKLNQS
jgi:hypothetical protein